MAYFHNHAAQWNSLAALYLQMGGVSALCEAVQKLQIGIAIKNNEAPSCVTKINLVKF